MLQVIDVIEPNQDIMEIIKKLDSTCTKGDVRVLVPSNAKAISPALYKFKLNGEEIIICEYKGEIKDNKNFYIPNSNKTYNLIGIKRYLNCL